MSFLTRDVLDKVIPKSIHLENRARKIVRIARNDRIPLEACLIWLADTIEHDRFSGFGNGKNLPDWVRGFSRTDHWQDLQIEGLEYKPAHKYLTAQGWPTGTKCWFVRMECGWREFVAHETPLITALRAVVVAHCWMQWRRIPPEERPDFVKMIQEFMAS
jgi:hypothetical protein